MGNPKLPFIGREWRGACLQQGSCQGQARFRNRMVIQKESFNGREWRGACLADEALAPQAAGPTPAGGVYTMSSREFISQEVFKKLMCKSQLPLKSVKSFFMITDIKNKLTDLCDN